MDPIKLVIDNYPDNKVEMFDLMNNPEDPSAGTRKVPFTKELYIEREDFMENPPKQFYRLYPGNEVRLRGAYCVKCVSCVKDADNGKVLEVHAVYDPSTRGGNAPKERKVKATLHWVSASNSFKAKARLYDRLFLCEDPSALDEDEFIKALNPDSFREVEVLCESFLSNVPPGTHLQFERIGYFYTDPIDSKVGMPVFNRTITLKDSWNKAKK